MAGTKPGHDEKCGIIFWLMKIELEFARARNRFELNRRPQQCKATSRILIQTTIP
jgi:hypothetical protein